MKHKKLSLDKLNVVRLNETQNILGGRLGYDDGDTAGIGVQSTPQHPYKPSIKLNPGAIPKGTTIGGTTKRPTAGSSIKCMPVSPWSRG